MIGNELTVTYALNPQLNGFCGVVVDETRNTYTLETSAGRKILVKEQIGGTE